VGEGVEQSGAAGMRRPVPGEVAVTGPGCALGVAGPGCALGFAADQLQVAIGLLLGHHWISVVSHDAGV
jgi:hypothetical protein